MIKTRTVFVLGAGASMPYGLPSGETLSDAIRGLSGTDARTVLHAQGLDQGDLTHFQDKYERFDQSIDAFLAKWADVPAFRQIGKRAIAMVLCRHEAPEKITQPEDAKDHWYRLLWQGMMPDGAKQFTDNKVRVITFNYDRSLEYYLHRTLDGSFGAAGGQAATSWSETAVLHVYGALGRLSEHAYGGKVTDRAIDGATAAIQVIPESRNDAPAFEQARKWFVWAQRVCFLGFSFEALNVQRLGLATIARQKEREGGGVNIYASTYGMTRAETERAAFAVCDGLHWNPGAEDWKSLKSLREWDWLRPE